MSNDNSKRFAVADYGFVQGSYDTIEEARAAERRINGHYWSTATYIIDQKTDTIVQAENTPALTPAK